MIRPAHEETTTTRSLGTQSQKVLQDVRELGSIALENAGEAVDRMKKQGRGTLAKGRQRVQQAKGGIEDYIAEHPVRSLLVALGVGALLGLALRRRHAPAATSTDVS